MVAGWITSPQYDRATWGAYQRRQHEVRQVEASITPEYAQAYIDLAGAYGGVADAGVLGALAQYATMDGTMYDPSMLMDDPVVQATVDAAGDDQVRRSFFGTLSWLGKGLVRNSFGVMEGLRQESFGTLRPTWQALSDSDVSFDEAWGAEMQRESYLTQIGQHEAFGGEGVDWGEGFIPGGRGTDTIYAQGGELLPGTERYMDPYDDDFDPQFYQQLEQYYRNAPRLESGMPITAGRFATEYTTPLEPGTRPYNLMSGLLDATMTIFLDPTNVASKHAPVVGRSARQFRQSMGLIDRRIGTRLGIRSTIDPDTAVNNYLRSTHGRRVIDHLAEESNWEQIWTLLSSKGRHSTVSREFTSRVAAATDPDDIFELLFNEIYSGHLRSRPQLFRNNVFNSRLPGINRTPRDIRLFNDMPGQTISLQNLDEGVGTVRNYLINAKIEPAARTRLLSEYADVNSLTDLQEFMSHMARTIDDQIAATVYVPRGAHQVARQVNLVEKYQDTFNIIWSKLRHQIADDLSGPYAEDARHLFVGATDDVGRWRQAANEIPGARQSAEVVDAFANQLIDAPPALLLSEMTDAIVPMLDRKAVRAAVERTTHILDAMGPAGDAVQGAAKLMDFFMSVAWKPMQLVRGAWTIRVLGEQQIRLQSLGIHNQFNHPIQAIAARLGMADAPFGVSAKGDAMEGWREFRMAMTRRSGGWLDDPARQWRTGNWKAYNAGEPEYSLIYADQFDQLISDEVGRTVARFMSDQADEVVTRSRRTVEQVGRHIPDPTLAAPNTGNLPTSPAQFAAMPADARSAFFDTLLGHIETQRAIRQPRRVAPRGGPAGRLDLTPEEVDRLVADVRSLRSQPPTPHTFSKVEDVMDHLVYGGQVGHGRHIHQYRQAHISGQARQQFPQLSDDQARVLAEIVDEMGPIPAGVSPVEMLTNILTDTQDYDGAIDAVMTMLFTTQRGARGRFISRKQFHDEFTVAWNRLYDEAVSTRPMFDDQAAYMRPRAGARAKDIDGTDIPEGLAAEPAGIGPTRNPFSDGPLGDAWDSGVPLTRTHVDQTPLAGRDAAHEWFWAGGGRTLRDRLGTDRVRSALFDAHGDGNVVDPMTSILNSRRAADTYIDGVIERIGYMTGNDSELLQAVATGKLNNHAYIPGSANTGFIRQLDKKIDQGMRPELYAPQFVQKDPEVLSSWRHVVNSAFDLLMTRPDNAYFRNPIFHQTYWERTVELANRLTPAAYDEVLTNATSANLPQKLMRRLQGAAGAGRLSVDDIDIVARRHALDSVRSTLYDLSRRSQFSESLSFLSPFAEAWREVLGFWSRAIINNPNIARRGELAIGTLRDPHFAGTIGKEDGQGFFYVNEHGDEVFAYPGSGILSQMVGLPEDAGITMEARAMGLNLVAASILPGVGPVVQYPAAMLENTFVPDIIDNILSEFTQGLVGRDAWDAIRQTTIPFGGPSDISEWAVDFMPAWMRQFLNGLTSGALDERGYQNLIGQVMKANILTGNYSRGGDDPDQAADQLQANYEASQRTARWLFTLRGLANNALPTTFRPKVTVDSIHGGTFELEVLAREFRDLSEQYDDQEQAVVEFLARYGMDPFLISQGRSRQVVPRSAFDAGGAMWEQANIELAREYPSTFGLYAPLDGEPADFAAYLSAVRDGHIVELTAEQQIALANNVLGHRQYMNTRNMLLDTVGETDAIREYLRQVRAALRVELPGFDTYIPGAPRTPSLDDQLREIERAITDDRLDVPVMDPLHDYWQMREFVQHLLSERGITLKATEGAVGERAFLDLYGGQLAQDHPEFLPLWTRVLSREVDR